MSHRPLVFAGLTLIEQSDRERFPQGKILNNYDLGVFRNFCVVFGKNPLVWFLPLNLNLAGSGLVFEKADIYVI